MGHKRCRIKWRQGNQRQSKMLKDTRQNFGGTSGSQTEVVEGISEVVRFAGSASPDKDERLVGARRQHGTVGGLGGGVNVWWHVLGFASAEQLDHLQKQTK